MRSITLKDKKQIVLNSDIELGEQEGNGKGRYFMSRFIEPGIAHYEELGDILITKETLNKFIQTMVGVPVIIDHEDVTDKNVDKLRVGTVSKVWFNESDGYFYCEGILTDKDAVDLVKNKGWNVSCAYRFQSVPKEMHNGKKIDMEFTDGEFLHLAIVKNPRYEGANIVVNKNDDVEWITVKGNHIPVKKGQSKDEAVKEFLEGKEAGKQNKEDDELVKLDIPDKPTKEAQEAIDKERERSAKIAEEHKKEYERTKDIDLSKLKLNKTDKSGDSEKKDVEKKLKKPKEVKLTEIDKELLKDGNNYHFAEMIAEHYPEEAKKAGMKSYINEYKKYTEYDKDNKEFILRYDNGDKAIFDTNFKLKTYKAYNSIGDITMQVLNELKEFIKSVVSNEKDEEMAVKNEDKRKLIDEIGGILKGKVDDEIIRTVIKKAEELSYEPSEDDKADNKAKNEDEKEDKEEAKNKCKNEDDKKEDKKADNEDDEEEDEDVTKNEDDEDDEEDKEEKAENKKVKNSMKDIVMGGKGQVQEQKLYISRKERLEEGNKY